MANPFKTLPSRTGRNACLAALLLTCTAAPSAGQTAPRTFTVATAAELMTAIRAARGGDTILLQPGSYGNLTVWGVQYSGGTVAIRSADPQNRARFGQMLLREVAGFRISGVDAQSALSPVVSISGRDIHFAGNRVRGSTANQNPLDDNQAGLWVRNASRVMVASNDFQDLRTAVWIQRSPNVAFRYNSVRHVREGINVSGTTLGDISHNLLTQFQPNYAKFEHPDGIQFWTTNETTGNSHITIRNNFLSFGNDGNVQGIFLRTENPALPHHNLEISGNIYYGSSQHGISLGTVNSSRITNNVVVASPWADRNDTTIRSADGLTGGGIQPYIRLGSGTDLLVTRNIAMAIAGQSSGRVVADNVDIYDSYLKFGEPWTAAFAARPTARTPALSEFVTRTPSAIATRGIGVLAPFPVGVVTLDPVQALSFAASQPLP